MAEGELLTVSQVIHRLKGIAPDLTVSKLHFYEREGLIRPYRTRGGHRVYCPNTVSRLRLLLLLRKRANLPLKTVASLLETLEKDPISAVLLIEWLQSPFTQGDPTVILSEKEAQKVSGLPMDIFQRVKTLGLVHPCPKTGKYDSEALVTLQAIRDLLKMGITVNDLIPYKIHIDAVLKHEEYLFKRIFPHNTSTDLHTVFMKFRESISRFRRFLFLNHLRRFIEKLLPGLAKDF